MNKFLALSLVLTLMCVSVFARGDIDNKVGGVKRGSDAPLFTTKDINGNTIKLVKTDEGLELFSVKADGESIEIIKDKKAVLLSVWSTLCPICDRDMPNLEKVHKNFKGKGLLVLGVNIDANSETIKAYNKKHKLTFNSVVDTEKKITKAYNANLTPTNYLINLKTGKIEVVYEGITANMLKSVEADVTMLLEKSSITTPTIPPKAIGGVG